MAEDAIPDDGNKGEAAELCEWCSASDEIFEKGLIFTLSDIAGASEEGLLLRCVTGFGCG
jgi:hypothetical protein